MNEISIQNTSNGTKVHVVWLYVIFPIRCERFVNHSLSCVTSPNTLHWGKHSKTITTFKDLYILFGRASTILERIFCGDWMMFDTDLWTPSNNIVGECIYNKHLHKLSFKIIRISSIEIIVSSNVTWTFLVFQSS